MYAQQYDTPPPVHAAATIFQKISYDNKDGLSAAFIVAGWDKEQGPSVYNVSLGGSVLRQPWTISGSGSSYIYGYCDATYRTGWNEQQTLEFVRNSVALAMARDGSSGGTIRMVVITEDGVTRHFIPGTELPTFWEGNKVTGLTPPKKYEGGETVPIDVEAS